MNSQNTKSFIIKNYNIKKKEYELGKERIIDLNKEDFKKFLNDLPIQVKYPYFNIEIYSRRLRIIKIEENKCDIANIQVPIQFAHYKKVGRNLLSFDKIVSILYDRPKFDLITDIKEIFKADYKGVRKKEQEKKEDKIVIIFAIIYSFFYILIIGSVFAMLIYVPIRYMEMMNTLTFVIWLWLLVLFPVNIYHMISGSTILKDRITQIKLSIPILDHFQTTKISKWVVNGIFTYGTLGLSLPILYLNLSNIDAQIFYILGIMAIIVHFYVIGHIIYAYYRSKSKDDILQDLLTYFQEEILTWDEKQYFLFLIYEFRKKKKVSIGYFSYIYAPLTLLLSFVPYIF